MGQNRWHNARFFPAKRLSIFLTQNQTPFKSTDFFLKNNFPAKRLSYFFEFFSWSLLKAQTFCVTKYFPPKDLVFFLVVSVHVDLISILKAITSQMHLRHFISINEFIDPSGVIFQPEIK